MPSSTGDGAARTSNKAVARRRAAASMPRSTRPIAPPRAAGAERIGIEASSYILRLPVAEGPIVPGDLDEVDEDILRTQTRILREPLDDAAIERLLLCDRARVAHRQLDDDEIIGALDVEIAPVEDEIFGLMLGDRREEIVRRHVEGLTQRRVDILRDGAAVRGRLPRLQ